MDFIFEHEQLRNAEAIDKMYQVKNSFTPLRPLKSVVSRKRRSTAHAPEQVKKNNSSYNSKHSTNTSIKSISPFISRLLKQLSGPNENHCQNLFNPNQKKILKANILPTIDSSPVRHRKIGIKLKKAYYPNIITHIPTISYLPN